MLFISLYFSSASHKGFAAHVAQLVERILGKDEVSGSNPLMGSSC